MEVVQRSHRRLWEWGAPLGIALLALVARLWRLGSPSHLMFDETYYVKDAWSLLTSGYSRDGVKGADDRIATGKVTDLFTQDPTWIVHPDGGKWMIASGQALFGLDPIGWRVASAVAGALMVLVLARLVLRLTDSLGLACVAGLLLAIDGVHFVMSRIALLDIFLALWILCFAASLAADRDWLAHRLASGRSVPWFRPWQVAAGVCAGLAVSTKWSALWVVAAFGITVVVWDLALRGWPGSLRSGMLRMVRIGVPAFAWIVVVGAMVYLATWTSWFIHHEVFEARFGHGYGDVPVWGAYLDRENDTWWTTLTDPLVSLWRFHQMTYDFHTGDYLAETSHPYQAKPWGWLLQVRPTSVDTVTDIEAAKCGAPIDSSCIREVLILGNPLIWWSGTVAVFVAVLAWFRRRTWQWSLPIVGVAATWLPWFFVGSRPIFAFYAVAILPFMIIALMLVLNGIRRRLGRPRVFWAGVVLFVLLLTAVSWWFLPLWTNELLSYDAWRARMWFPSWI